MTRYRYIFTGRPKPNDNIKDYRLLDKQKLGIMTIAVRVEIPEDVKLKKYKCDSYSTWEDKRQYKLKDLNPVICITTNGIWNKFKKATKDWLNGEDFYDAIDKELNSKGYYDMYDTGVGYLKEDQYDWCIKNKTLAWRLDKIPDDVSNIKIPPLTLEELRTLSYVREQFDKYCEECVDEYFDYEGEEKEDFKDYLKTRFHNMNDDELAYKWHKFSTKSRIGYKNFETLEQVEKIKSSSCLFVWEDHYKYAVSELIDSCELAFLAYYEKKKEEKEENEDYER